MKKTVILAFLLLVMATGVPSQARADEISEKLNKVIESQNQILAKLDEIKAELLVVKVRATQQ